MNYTSFPLFLQVICFFPFYTLLIISNCWYGNTKLQVQLSTVTNIRKQMPSLHVFLNDSTNQGDTKQVSLEGQMLERTD